jgi:hypothetical protein
MSSELEAGDILRGRNDRSRSEAGAEPLHVRFMYVDARNT